MSVSEPFLFALVCDVIGADEARHKLGVNGTGLALNSLAAVEQSGDGRTNPLVNPGAIATTSLVPGLTLEEKWRFVHDGLSAFAGRRLPLNEEVYSSAGEFHPEKGGLGTFAPPLDSAGSSVKGQLVAKFLSDRLGMNLFVSQPEVSPTS
jgi:glutaminase